MFAPLSTSLILRGILAIGVGITALAWPGLTVFALVMLFAVLAFFDAGEQLLSAYSSATAKPVFRHLALGLIDLAAGVVALAWPAPTALVLVLIVASWAVVVGLFEISAGFWSQALALAGTPAMYVLAGLASVAFGLALFTHATAGAVTLALLFGMFNVIYGVWQLAVGIDARQTGKALNITEPEMQLL